MGKNKLTEKVICPRLTVGFYTYEFDNSDLKFKVTHVDTVDVSFIQTSKWYKLYICINGEFTGRFLNLQSILDLEYYSMRKEIGIAYRNYRDGMVYVMPAGSEVSDTIVVPIGGMAIAINLIVKNKLSKINKFASRDELTELKLL